MSLIKNFQQYGNNLTELEIESFQKLLAFENLQPSLTISSLAEALNVSTTTIFRMVKKLNYKTFMDFRYDLLYHRQDEFVYNATDENIIDVMEKEIRDTMTMLKNIEIDEMIKDIINAKSVLICSSGMNKYVAKILAVKLSLYGIRTIYPDDSWFLYLEANNLTKDDFVIVLSRSGTTPAILDVMKNAKLSGCKMLLITEHKNSPMNQLADHTMNVSLSEDEGYDIDSRLHIHLAIEYLLRKLVNQYLYNKKYL
ncbi:MurR/RpiR family transcriptional regulator [Thomasclavelia sp.]|uniref:MurR/RpiR family transcriptional regulator n=1 Tax=Thomasclavelia sp. TaxID=3025757 RepID=UPI0025FDC601|nr:MurR/RpiR family transcriptional regulator [Thomasclavelia sp.]